MAKYKDKKGNEIEAELFKEGMEDCWIVMVSGGYGIHTKKFKSKKSALNFIEKNKGAEFITKNGGSFFNAEKINYYLHIKIGESFINEFEENYIINFSKKDQYLIDRQRFEKKYKLKQ